MTMGALKRAFKSAPRSTPVKRMFGATTTKPAVGIDHARHGDADGRQIVGA